MKSAEWAFDWGIKEENRCIYKFKYKGRNLTYREPDVEETIIARAALVLYRLTREDKYKNYIFKNITSTKYDEKYTLGVKKLEDLRAFNPIDSMAVAIFKDDSDFDSFLNRLNSSAFRSINFILNYQENYTE